MQACSSSDGRSSVHYLVQCRTVASKYFISYTQSYYHYPNPIWSIPPSVPSPLSLQFLPSLPQRSTTTTNKQNQQENQKQQNINKQFRQNIKQKQQTTTTKKKRKKKNNPPEITGSPLLLCVEVNLHLLLRRLPLSPFCFDSPSALASVNRRRAITT